MTMMPAEERRWAVGVVLVAFLLFCLYAAYEITRPERPEKSSTVQSR